jgi:hypothetical protein
MADETKRTLYESQPDKYRILESGAVQDISTGKMIDNLGGKYTLTPARASDLAERRRQMAVLSHMRGVAKGAGIELSEDASLDEIIQGAGNGIEAYMAHLGKTFLKSESIRGQGEAYGQIVRPILGDDRGKQDGPVTIIQNNYAPGQAAIMEQIWRDVMHLHEAAPEVIDAQATDPDDPHWTAHKTESPEDAIP